MQQKIREYQKTALLFAERLRDVKFAGLVLFLFVVLLISWSGVKSIQSNYQLQKQISTLQQQNAVQKLSNNNLQLENEYYNTDSYLDLSARQNFGLGAPGEKEIIVPKAVALGYTTPLPKSQAVTTPTEKLPTTQRNFQAWVNFFLHRPNSVD